MNIQEPFSKLKKKLKHKLAGGRQKSDGIGIGSDGERADPTSSLPRPESRVAVGGGRAGRPPQPDDPGSEPAGESGTYRKERDVKRGELTQRYSHLPPDIEVGVGSGSGPGREGDSADGERVEQRHSSPSATLHSEKPDSTWI